MENQREIELQAWCEAVTGHSQGRLQPVSGDASFRRYFRTHDGMRSVVAVDAPPPQESLQPFMAIAEAYADAGVQVPEVIAANAEHGFMLLTDLGSTLLLSELTEANAPSYYRKALAALPAIMRVTSTSEGALPPYDEALLRRELGLFHDWLCEKHLNLIFSDAERDLWDDFCTKMVQNALEQPQVGVHRDFHARNIMVLPEQQLAYIDFQDAVKGPITYDAVSLLRDCYVRWPSELVDELMQDFRGTLQTKQLLPMSVTAQQWQRWFDWMGLQRHTKAAGIFARLYHRDGKKGYLQDIPRTVSYLHDVAARYPELTEYRLWLQQRVMPALAEQS
ncbi:serine/threonine protein kinase [Pseudidiomarina aestuarii]|uniref:Serine/threonine protein kinase n=1 Tax=Pseudidiomarina aestuarii TaxID=624146 RepID=A0A7Z6ZRT9_9GAMM|nr:phosphotransferase [Pseudidiomarina aestuarii]RUO38053.1 serine/threonine protein kinase [Pseudidiomarina aestuarii]